ncbi:MAG: hypothetical protein HQL48_11280 [Gammaproteobacteria bacterium]|nr:hypothetical protein [Gammaproteobacteria bacterium]
MMTVKEMALDVVENQPEDVSWEEIMRELTFERMVERGLADSQADRVIPHSAMAQRIAQWHS